MSRWMVNTRGQQFSATDMDELRQLARKGMLAGGDIVQPPGASEWIYALEVPELKSALPAHALEDFDVAPASTGPSPVVKAVAAVALAGIAVGAWSYAIDLSRTIPQPEDLELLGEKGLTYTEVLVTQDGGAQLRQDAAQSSAAVATLAKNSKADLLAKRGSWYRLRADGKEGYVPVDAVIPAYFFADERTKLDYDPLYNPDRYVHVANSSWMLLPSAEKKDTTLFQFMLQNDSKFRMTDLKLLATIKDKNDQVLEQKEIPVEGLMPGQQGIMVGTLAPGRGETAPRIMLTSTFEELVAQDPAIAARWTDGVEVKLEDIGWTEASITLLEVRAVPPEEMPG